MQDRIAAIETRLTAIENLLTATKPQGRPGGAATVTIERTTQRTTKAGQPMAKARVARTDGTPRFFDVIALGEDAATLAALGEGWHGTLEVSTIKAEKWTGSDGSEKTSHTCFLESVPPQQAPQSDGITDDDLPDSIPF